MVILPPEQYSLAYPLLEGFSRHHLIVKAVYQRSVPGAVLVDQLDSPRAALLHGRYRYLLACPRPDPSVTAAIRRYFEQEVYPKLLQSGQESLMLFYSPQDRKIESLFAQINPVKVRRQHYTFRSFPQARPALPPGFTLRPVDMDLMNEERLDNLEALREEMCSESPSVESFLGRCFGVCLVDEAENRLAGWCLSEYNSGTRCEIGIETVAPYRRRGFATVMTVAFVELGLSKGYTQIDWDCWTHNVPSVASARKAGFEKVLEYEVLLINAHPVHGLAMKGYFLGQEGHPAAGLAALRQAMAAGDTRDWLPEEAASLEKQIREP